MTEETTAYDIAGSTIAEYWRCYGGVRALVRSPYLHMALAAAIVLSPAWYSREWWNTVTAVLPNIVGFSIGGYAIWIGFGDERFKAIIAGPSATSEISPYMRVSATFSHFVVVQLAAIAWAIGAGAFYFDASDYAWARAIARGLGTNWSHIATVLRVLGGFFGFWLFMYALTSALATVFAIFEVAGWYDSFRAMNANLRGKRSPSPATPSSNGTSDAGEPRARTTPEH
jgi:hypothetical protein